MSKQRFRLRTMPCTKRLVLSIVVLFSATIAAAEEDGAKRKLTVFVAKKIITMDTANPSATAVAVADGKIVSVGSLESLKPWLNKHEATIDESFNDKILLPGFIDPHVHPSLPAILTQFPFLAPEHWSLPSGEFPAAKSQKEYLQRLSNLVDDYKKTPEADPNIPFVTWGYHSLWHGDIYRAELDVLFPETPVILWQRSFHELIANSRALQMLGINEQEVQNVPNIDWVKGHFWELGARYIVGKMGFLFAPERFGKGLQNFVAMLHQGGVTTAMDMGTGIFGNAPQEMALIQQAMNPDSVPSRMILTPIIVDFSSRGVSPKEALAEVNVWKENNSEKVFFADHFKLMLDGAIFSGLAQFNFPGYIDGHHGEWLTTEQASTDYAQAFWNEGYQIHAHTNGDKAAARLIDLVGNLQSNKPRTNHRTTLEHFAYASQDQIRQLANLDIAVSANPYYQYILSDVYAEQWLGEDRARNMVPLGGAAENKIPIALHSDSPMAPLSPLTLVWAAVNRTSIGNNENNANQKLSVDQALRAITIDAAWVANREQEIGSIRAGKTADFVILEQDPYKVAPAKLKDIKIWGTVFEGKKHPL